MKFTFQSQKAPQGHRKMYGPGRYYSGFSKINCDGGFWFCKQLGRWFHRNEIFGDDNIMPKFRKYSFTTFQECKTFKKFKRIMKKHPQIKSAVLIHRLDRYGFDVNIFMERD